MPLAGPHRRPTPAYFTPTLSTLPTLRYLMPHSRKPIAATLFYGSASLLLYILLFLYADQFVAWAEQTKDHKALFLIPVVVAFIFSYFHGAFTGLFWEILGLRAAKSGGKQ